MPTRAEAIAALTGPGRRQVPGVVVLRDEPLPRNATGKLLKRQLRDELVS